MAVATSKEIPGAALSHRVPQHIERRVGCVRGESRRRLARGLAPKAHAGASGAAAVIAAPCCSPSLAPGRVVPYMCGGRTLWQM
jgi:hypothetical protein